MYNLPLHSTDNSDWHLEQARESTQRIRQKMSGFFLFLPPPLVSSSVSLGVPSLYLPTTSTGLSSIISATWSLNQGVLSALEDAEEISLLPA